MASSIKKYSLSQIKWSDVTLSFNTFLKKYQLPQIIRIEEGVYGNNNVNTFSLGETLKLHTIVKERTVLCINKKGEKVSIPFNSTDKIRITPNATVYKFCDVLKWKPLPTHVIVTDAVFEKTLGVCNVKFGDMLALRHESRASNGRGDYDDVVGEYCYIEMDRVDEITLEKPNGEQFSCPRTFTAPVKLVFDHTAAYVNQILPNINTKVSPITFFMENKQTFGALVSECIYDQALVIASQIVDKNSYISSEHADIFSIDGHLDLQVRAHKGCFSNDPLYEDMRFAIHQFPDLEEDFLEILHNDGKPNKFTYYQNTGVISQRNVKPVKKLNEKKPELPIRQARVGYFDPQFTNRPDVPPKLSVTQQAEMPAYTGSSNLLKVPKGALKWYEELKTEVSTNVTKSHYEVPDSIQSVATNQENEDIITLTTNEVSALLKTLNLLRHVESFQTNQIDGCLLNELEKEELLALGLNSFEAKKLLAYTRKGWRPKI